MRLISWRQFAHVVDADKRRINHQRRRVAVQHHPLPAMGMSQQPFTDVDKTKGVALLASIERSPAMYSSANNPASLQTRFRSANSSRSSRSIGPRCSLFGGWHVLQTSGHKCIGEAFGSHLERVL